MNENDFIGLTKKGAQQLAEKNNLIFRIISVDGVAMFSYPTDVRTDRICIEMNRGEVIVAKLQ
jgi:hypothetical protein